MPLMDGARRVRSLLRRCFVSAGLRFREEDTEVQFLEKEGRFTVTLMYFWVALTTVFLILALFIRCNKYGWFKHPNLVFSLYFIPFGILGLVFLSLRIPCFKGQHYYLLCTAYLGFIAWVACSVHLNVGEDRGIVEATDLPDVFAALQHDERATAILHRYVGAEIGRKYLWYALVLNHYHLELLQFLDLTWLSVLVFASVPASLWTVSYVSPYLSNTVQEVLVAAIISMMYTLGLSYYNVVSRRRQFAAEHELQRQLEKEAATLKEAAQQEAELKEASQEADTILNHLLKNVMADAAGCIHLYLQSPSNPPPHSPPDLVQAMECLERGVAWCRKRQALLRIASGRYTPQLFDVDLTQFGNSLLQGRPIQADFPAELVTIDPLLCEIVLENALTNAHRHGHPTEPNVRFTAALTVIPGDASPPHHPRRRLTFAVTNRADPTRPPLTPELIARLLKGDAHPRSPTASRLSENLGMRHLTQAAAVHNMELHLSQVGDVVYFEGTLDVALPTVINVAQTPCPECPAVVPPNLRVFCVDDSPVARRLLVHTLSGEPMRASVVAFGKTLEEVVDFLEQAVHGADIVILDYHLDYGSIHLLGTELLRSLLDQGYEGLICIRSANASPYDEALYVEAGAHCCIGKDVHPKAMAAALMAAYLRREAQAGRSPSPGLGQLGSQADGLLSQPLGLRESPALGLDSVDSADEERHYVVTLVPPPPPSLQFSLVAGGSSGSLTMLPPRYGKRVRQR
eukprot:EG_transcript_1829